MVIVFTHRVASEEFPGADSSRNLHVLRCRIRPLIETLGIFVRSIGFRSLTEPAPCKVMQTLIQMFFDARMWPFAP